MVASVGLEFGTGRTLTGVHQRDELPFLLHIGIQDPGNELYEEDNAHDAEDIGDGVPGGDDVPDEISSLRGNEGGSRRLGR